MRSDDVLIWEIARLAFKSLLYQSFYRCNTATKTWQGHKEAFWSQFNGHLWHTMLDIISSCLSRVLNHLCILQSIKGKLRWNLFCLLYQFFSFKNNTCLVKNKIESPGFRLYHVQDHLKVVWTKRLIESFRSISSSHEINNNQRLILLQQELVKSLLGNIKAAIWLAYSNFYVNSYSNQKHALS